MLSLSAKLVEATAFADERSADDASSVLDDLITSLVATTIDNRTAGGLYRWERRYLQTPTKMPSNTISRWSTAASNGRWPPGGPNSPSLSYRHCQGRRSP